MRTFVIFFGYDKLARNKISFSFLPLFVEDPAGPVIWRGLPYQEGFCFGKMILFLAKWGKI